MMQKTHSILTIIEGGIFTTQPFFCYSSDSEPEYRAILEASFKFKPGAFACRVVWERKFDLHHKLCTGKVGSKGILALRTILNPFSVNNRKNMFVYEDKSGNGSHVFYVR